MSGNYARGLNETEWLLEEVEQTRRLERGGWKGGERPDEVVVERRARVLEGVDRTERLDNRPADHAGFNPPTGPLRLPTRDGEVLELQPYGGGYVHLKPGTPEFAAKYIPPAEPVIEQIRPSRTKPEGFDIVRCDGVTGEPLES